MLRFILFCLLTWAASEVIDPSRVQVITVLDVASPQITRDCLTLIRSLRLHGGSLNQATLTVYVPIANRIFYSDEYDIFPKLEALHVEIAFIDQAVPPSPRTLNKFSAWSKFDFHRFDYMLWLDADTFVVADPLPMIQEVSHGSLQTLMCAPELYSYLRRFPHVNETNLFTNPNLSQFRLLGEAEIVPHGVCNTGVVFAERSYLQAFMYELPYSILEIDAMNPYTRDRFLDSLYFVRTVHRVGKPLLILPYDLNFMTFFEHEIQEEVPTALPVIVHHLFSTEIKCEEDTTYEPPCICIYNNDKRIPYSLIALKLNDVIPFTCASMIGATDTELGNVARQAADSSLASDDETNAVDYDGYTDVITMKTMMVDGDHESALCHLMLPQHHSLIRVSSLKEQYPNEIYVQCNKPIMNLAVSCELRSNHGHINSSKEEVSEIFETLNFEYHRFNSSTHRIRGMFNQASCFNGTFLTAWMKSKITVKVKLVTEVEYFVTQSSIKTVVNQLLSPGLVNYQANLLLGTTPLSLASQLHLPGILNDRHQVGIGLMLCCDTNKGVLTIYNLIDTWVGETLIIMILNAPKDVPGVDFLNLSIENRCSSSLHKLKCVIKAGSLSRSLITTMSPKSLSFFYTDVYSGVGSYKTILVLVYHKLAIHGIMMGSRYITDWKKSFFLARAVDDFASIHIPVAHNIFATYDEPGNQCINDREECAVEWKRDDPEWLHDMGTRLCSSSPAWYIIKEID